MCILLFPRYDDNINVSVFVSRFVLTNNGYMYRAGFVCLFVN